MSAQKSLLGPPNSPPSASDRLERKEAAEAYRKALAGEALTSREKTALRKFEKEKEERLRWQFYTSIPQKHWKAMSGRQLKVLQEQAGLYGLPFGGLTVSLPDVVRALHDFLAANAYKLAQDDLLGGGNSPALERYREERAALARLDREEREGKLVDRQLAKEALGRMAARLRSAGETLQRQVGAEARAILDEALDDCEREIDRTFGSSDGQPDEACAA